MEIKVFNKKGQFDAELTEWVLELWQMVDLNHLFLVKLTEQMKITVEVEYTTFTDSEYFTFKDGQEIEK